MAASNLQVNLNNFSLDGLTRIDVGMEGDWNPSVVTVWSRDRGLLGFDRVARRHHVFKPSIELYFEDGWIGVHCYTRIDDQNHFDESKAREIICMVEERLHDEPVLV